MNNLIEKQEATDTQRSLDTLKQILKSRDVIEFQGDDRQIRKAISELRYEGIIFIPASRRTYKRVDLCTKVEIIKFLRTQVASLKTNYFNSVIPVNNVLKSMNESELYVENLIDDLGEMVQKLSDAIEVDDDPNI